MLPQSNGIFDKNLNCVGPGFLHLFSQLQKQEGEMGEKRDGIEIYCVR